MLLAQLRNVTDADQMELYLQQMIKQTAEARSKLKLAQEPQSHDLLAEIYAPVNWIETLDVLGTPVKPNTRAKALSNYFEALQSLTPRQAMSTRLSAERKLKGGDLSATQRQVLLMLSTKMGELKQLLQAPLPEDGNNQTWSAQTWEHKVLEPDVARSFGWVQPDGSLNVPWNNGNGYLHFLQYALPPLERERVFYRFFELQWDAKQQHLRDYLELYRARANLLDMDALQYSELGLDITVAEIKKLVRLYGGGVLWEQVQEENAALAAAMGVDELQLWDRGMAQRLMLAGLTEEWAKAAEYLKLDSIRDAVFDAAFRRYRQLRLTKVNLPLWSAAAEIYTVTRGDDLLGYIALDFESRPGKSTQTQCRFVRVGGQRMAVINGSFYEMYMQSPSYGPTFVASFKHEFGHALALLSQPDSFFGLDQATLEIPTHWLQTQVFANDMVFLNATKRVMPSEMLANCAEVSRAVVNTPGGKARNLLFTLAALEFAQTGNAAIALQKMWTLPNLADALFLKDEIVFGPAVLHFANYAGAHSAAYTIADAVAQALGNYQRQKGAEKTNRLITALLEEFPDTLPLTSLALRMGYVSFSELIAYGL